MPKRAVILASMIAGALWAVLVIWVGPIFPMIEPYVAGLGLAYFIAALPMIAMVGRLAQRRYFNDSIIDGQPLHGAAEIDQRVLTNTVEQLVLALCIWPLAGWVLGIGTVISLGCGFALMRLLFWVGYHLSPPLRGLGFAGTFYPTVLAAFLTLREAFEMLVSS